MYRFVLQMWLIVPFAAIVTICHGFLPIKAGRLHFASKSSRGCVFGSETHAIGSSWYPDLGPPFFIMYCVTCRCVKVTETSTGGRAKAMAKVVCQDVRKDCLPVTCKGAKVPRGECCKVCPEDNQHYSEDVKDDSSFTSKWENDEFFHRSRDFLAEKAINDEDMRANNDERTKHFVSLMTSTNGGPLVRATFDLRRDNLHFSLHHKFSERPATIQLRNGDGAVIYDHVTEPSPKTNQPITCGVWRNLAKHVLSALEKKTLNLRAIFSVINDDDIELNVTSSGRVVRHRALSRETFSSLLALNTAPQDGSSGALVMLTLGRQRFNKLHFALMFKSELHVDGSDEDSAMTIRLVNLQNKVLRSTDKKFVAQEDEMADVWHTNSEILKGLGEGSLRLELIIKAGGQENYIGDLTARITCDLLQSVLSGNDCIQPANTGAAGSAIFTINSDNSVAYQVSLVGMSSAVTSISLLGDYKKKRTRVMADLTSQYRNGKAEGRLKVLNGKELHLLLSDRVRIAVQTEQSNSGELAGHVGSLLYSGHLARYKGLPVQLAGSMVRPPVFTGAAGHAWLELNEDCHLHYEIVVSGLNKDADTSVRAHLHGLAEISGLETKHNQLLKGFYGNEASGIVREMTAEIYEHLNNGTAFVQIVTKRNPNGEIRGRVHIPNNCSSIAQRTKVEDDSASASPLSTFPTEVVAGFADVDAVVHDGAAPSLVLTETSLELDSSSCYADGRWKAEGSRWAPSYDQKCTVCICERGSVLCDPVFCPALTCDRPLALETECCPVCNDGFGSIPIKEDESLSIGSFFGSSMENIFESRNNVRIAEKDKATKEGCYYENDGQIHPYGSWWHPVFPRFGRIACANCTCRSDGDIVCGKVVCPLVTCENPVKENPDDCCKTCPATTTTHRRHHDRRMQEDSGVRMCEFGRELRAPGEQWNLKIPTIARLNCFVCSCATHGLQSKCERKCPPIKLDCGHVERTTKSCCPWRCLGRRKHSLSS